MWNKLSFRIALLFFIFITIIELLLFFVLYSGLASNRIEEVLEGLQARGNSHRDVLEKNFDVATLNHVALMETEASTDVVIIDMNGEVLATSAPISLEKDKLIKAHDHHDSHQGRVIEERWKTEPYIATLAPIVVEGELRGYLYMFSPSSSVENVVTELSTQFLYISLVTIILTVITIFILTRFITRPLINMKKVTEKISTGKTSVSLPTLRNDELGELSRAIQTLASDLDHLKQERNEFLASIAHELRTPLTYVKGYADIAARENLSQQDREKYLQILKEEATHLTMLVKNLFDLAKMDQNEFAIEQACTPLCQPLKKVTERVAPVFEQHKIQIHMDCPDELEVYIDEERIQQVILNLLDNVLKHSPPESNVNITASEKQKHVQLKIQDEGEGIPDEDLPYVFDRLYRVDKSRSRASGGTGLGLAIVQEIIRLHGGSIFVESQMGKGTTFIIELPRGKDDE
ncbi:sensor histidine kinase [Thalassobacillus hwangdonensis]|uniref:histidine kinase n=1 Tax=Thalassobacillus hwangdonensis TaxID=546108 RepID=A0ABW3L6V7_9BACI